MGNCYRSCHYIENALILHPNDIYHCCIPVNGKFGSTHISEFHGGEFPIAKILESRDKYRKALSDIENHKDFHCYGCIHAHENNWDNKYLFNNLHFNHSIICNLNCNNCIQRGWPIEHQRASYDALPIVKMLTEQKLLAPDSFIFWAGGEPTLLPDFDESLELMMAYGTKNEVATNSTIFSEVIYKNLKQNGNLTLKTSIDCGTPEKFLEKKEKDWFYRTWENLSKYASTGADVSAKYIICDDNCDTKELEGFAEMVKKNDIKASYIDIDHNLDPTQVLEKHINATVELTKMLKSIGVNVDVGLHSTASIPDFLDRVARASNDNTMSKYLINKNVIAGNKMNESSNRLQMGIMSKCFHSRLFSSIRKTSPYKVLRKSNVGTKLGKVVHCYRIGRAVENGCPHVPAVTDIEENTEESVKQFTARGETYFEDIAPAPLSRKHLVNCKILPDRLDIIDEIAKGGIAVEVGTQTGFLAKEILKRMQPEKLHIIDIDYTPFDHEYFKPFIDKGQVELHEGDSATILSSFPDKSFDFIYVDGDHSYTGAKRDIEQSVHKIKDNGIIVCNDYTIFSPLEGCKYGVPRAVHEAILEHGFEASYLGLHKWVIMISR